MELSGYIALKESVLKHRLGLERHAPSQQLKSQCRKGHYSDTASLYQEDYDYLTEKRKFGPGVHHGQTCNAHCGSRREQSVQEPDSPMLWPRQAKKQSPQEDDRSETTYESALRRNDPCCLPRLFLLKDIHRIPIIRDYTPWQCQRGTRTVGFFPVPLSGYSESLFSSANEYAETCTFDRILTIFKHW